MSLWEYKVISSGKGGFATPALLEKFLNDLGRDEWEIVEFRSQPDNALAFSGLARRSTQRDWTLEDAAAAAAKAEAEKLRAEFEAKFKAATSAATPGAAEERAPSFLEEKLAPDDGFRKPVDTSRDDEPEDEEEKKADEWDQLDEEDALPTFFDAIKPHMRRNQRGPGQSVGVDYLAKKWDQSEDDLKGALVECGFEIPADEDAPPVHVEYDGDLYWLNINRRGELWINTKEKPRPMFRPVKAARVAVEEPAAGERKPDTGGRRQEAGERRQEQKEPAAETATTAPEQATSGAPAETTTKELPAGADLLNKIRPHMRRNRRGPGGSGSTNFLSRALRCKEDDLKAAFVALGLALPTSPNEQPVYIEIGREIWWLNSDSRGGVWINGREKKPGETLAAAAAAENASAESASASPAPEAAHAPEVATAASGASSETSGGGVLAGVRLLLKETRTGGIAAKIDRLAEELGKPAEEFLATLAGAGLKVPEKPREKPVFVEHAGEIFWLNKNAKGELWLNAKASKFAEKSGEGAESQAAAGGEASAEGDGEKKPRRSRSRKKESSEPAE
ncbi:MAG TPA: hypothetical protein VHD62_18145 [Opitutaceae bacterium]|nr:hypothetical protein [Opitutaceae bacterium]